MKFVNNFLIWCKGVLTQKRSAPSLLQKTHSAAAVKCFADYDECFEKQFLRSRRYFFEVRKILSGVDHSDQEIRRAEEEHYQQCEDLLQDGSKVLQIGRY